mmetsp:Transcript_25760/g.52952  ORF Transcript_25760/g.52952 Transcript_25760/m.52952 type:complete len:103 (+) Transcript_25760:73-381(+)
MSYMDIHTILTMLRLRHLQRKCFNGWRGTCREKKIQTGREGRSRTMQRSAQARLSGPCKRCRTGVGASRVQTMENFVSKTIQFMAQQLSCHKLHEVVSGLEL